MSRKRKIHKIFLPLLCKQQKGKGRTTADFFWNKIYFPWFSFFVKTTLTRNDKRYRLECNFFKKLVSQIFNSNFLFFCFQAYEKIVNSSFYSKNMPKHEKTFFRQKFISHLSYESITLTKFFNFFRICT